jgi:hypothetical protein
VARRANPPKVRPPQAGQGENSPKVLAVYKMFKEEACTGVQANNNIMNGKTKPDMYFID